MSGTRRLRHVRQRGDADCGVAALAMAANVSYRQALRAFGSVVPVSEGAMLIALRVLTGQRWRLYRTRKPKPLAECTAPKSTIVAGIYSPCGRNGHWIVVATVDGQAVVFDPGNQRPRRLHGDGYQKGAWIVREFLKADG